MILASTWEDEWHDYKEWLEKKLACAGRSNTSVKIQRIRLSSPIDYTAITKVMHKQLAYVSDQADGVFLNLTSGTPAMTTLSVLIGKGKANVQFLQTTPKNELMQVDVPIDFGREYLKSASKNIASSATSLPKIEQAFSELTANSSEMKRVVEKAKRISASEVPALILGDTGTGKELMATAIHKGSLRGNKPLKIINCGAFAESLVDSTLFGHKSGAFTGATKDHPGLFEQANGGTLFLDEVGELTPEIQVKLLRALQQGEINRLGDTKTINVDVRVIAATNCNLKEKVSHDCGLGPVVMPWSEVGGLIKSFYVETAKQIDFEGKVK